MDFEYKKEFYNLKYGKCYLIDEKENLYLIYADKCFSHYIVCTYIEPNKKQENILMINKGVDILWMNYLIHYI